MKDDGGTFKAKEESIERGLAASARARAGNHNLKPPCCFHCGTPVRMDHKDIVLEQANDLLHVCNGRNKAMPWLYEDEEAASEDRD